jgi:ketosteroid isomerase-like protein
VTSDEEKNKAIARRFLEAQAKGDLDTLDELLAPEFIDHSSFPGQEPGCEGYKQQVAEQPVGEDWEQKDDITLLTLRRSASLG